MSDVGEHVTLRRRELGMSRGQLADAIGATVGAVQALEGGADLDNWPLRLVRRLLRTLGLRWDDFEGGPPVPPEPIERLGAELARTGELPIEALPPKSVDATIVGLQAALHDVGMTVAVDAGVITVVPRGDVAPLDRVADTGSRRIGTRGLSGPERDGHGDLPGPPRPSATRQVPLTRPSDAAEAPPRTGRVGPADTDRRPGSRRPTSRPGVGPVMSQAAVKVPA